MATSIDQRVVQMQFDNAQFEKGVQETLNSLNTLNDTINKNTANTGKQAFSGMENQLNQVNSQLNKSGKVFDALGQKISAMGTIGDQVLRNMTNSITGLVGNGLRKLTAGIRGGFGEYEEKIGSIQTIMMGTGESLETVSNYLDELNHYADKTIYSFHDMTSNIGKFTNQGVKLKDAVDAIQGIANEAALSGANAAQASHAMYNFAQALSMGYVGLMDWKSIENAMMSTSEFRDVLVQTGAAVGTLTKDGDKFISTTTNAQGKVSDAFNATKGFRESLNHQWLTTEVLTKALKVYSSNVEDMKNEEREAYEQQLARWGFNEKQIKQLEEIGTKAFAAATQIKTFTQMCDTLNEAIGSGWAKTFELIFGDFDQAKALWTPIGNTLGDFIGKIADARNNLLQMWNDAEFGGRATLIKALTEAWYGLLNVLQPVAYAFKSVFQAIGVDQMRKLTYGIYGFIEAIAPTEEGMTAIYTVAVRLFTIISDIGKVVGTVIQGVLKLVAPIVNVIGAIFDAVTNLFELLTGSNTANKLGSKIEKFGSDLGKFYLDIMDKIADGLNAFADFLRNVDMAPFVQKIKDGWNAFKDWITGLPIVQDLMQKLSDVTEGASTPFEKFIAVLSAIGEKIREVAGKIKDALTTFFQLPAVQQFGQDILKVIQLIGLGIGDLAVLIGKGVSAIWKQIKKIDLNKISDSILKFRDNVINAFSKIGKFFTRIFNGEKFGQAFINTFGTFPEIIDKIKDKFNDMADTFKSTDFGSRVAEQFDKMKDAAKNTFDNIKQFFNDLFAGKSFADSFKDAFGDPSQIFANIQTSVSNFFNWFRSTAVGGFLANIGQLILNKIKSIVNSISQFFHGLASGQGFVESFRNSFGTVSTLIDKFKDKFVSLKDAIKATDLGRSISDMFSNIGDAIKKAWDKIKEFFDIFDDEKKIGVNGDGTYGSMTDAMGIDGSETSTMDRIKGGLQGLIDKLKEFGSTLDTQKIFVIVFGGAMLALAVNLAKAVKSVGGFFDTLTGAVNIGKRLMTAVKDSLKPNKASSIILQISTAIGILAASLYVLSKIPADQLDSVVKTLWQLVAVFVVLSAIAAAAEVVMYKFAGGGWDFQQFATGMILLVGSFIAIAGALKILDMVKLGKDILAKIGLVSLVLGELIACEAILAHVGGTGKVKGAVGVLALALALAGSLYLICKSFEKIAALNIEDYESIAKNLIVLMGMLAALSLVAKGISLSSALGLLIVVAVFDKLAPKLANLSKLEPYVDNLIAFVKKYQKALIMLGAVATVMTIVASLLGKGLAKFGLGIALMSVALINVGIFMRLLKDLSPEEINQGIHAMMAFMVLVTLMEAVSVIVNGKAFLGFAAGIDLLSIGMYAMAGLVAIFGQMNPGDMVKGLVAVSWLTLLIVAMEAVSHVVKGAGVAALIFEITGLIALSGLVIILSQVGWENLLPGLQALTWVAGVLSGVMIAMASASRLAKTAGGSIAMVLAAMVSIGGLMVVLQEVCSRTDPEELASACNGLIKVAGVLSGVMIAMASAGKIASGSVLQSIAVLASSAIALGGLMFAISEISKNGDPAQAAQICNALVPVAESLAIVMLACAAAGSIGAAAFVGIGVMAAVIGVIAGILAAFGALKEYTGYDDLINGALDMLGQHLQKVMQGIADAVTTANIIPNLDEGVLLSVAELIALINELGGAELASALNLLEKNFIGLFTDKDVVAESMQDLGDMLNSFSDSISDLSEDDIQKIDLATQAIEALANSGKALPNSGGLISLFTGNNDFGDFGKNIEEFAPDFADLVMILRGLNLQEQDVTIINTLCDCLDVLSHSGKAIPNSGGLIGLLVGENDFGDFGDNLKEFAPGFADAIMTIRGLNVQEQDVTNIGIVCDILEALSDSGKDIPNEGGLISWVVGDNKLDEFSNEFPTFASNIKTLVETLNSIKGLDDLSSIDHLIGIVQRLAAMNNTINEVTNSVFTGGDSPIAAWSDSLIDFAKNIKKVIDSLNSIKGLDNLTNIDKLVEITGKLADLNNKVTGNVDKGGVFISDSSSISIFADSLVSFAKNIRKVFDELNKIGDIDSTKVDVVISATDQLIRLSNKLQSVTTVSTSSGYSTTTETGGSLADFGGNLKGYVKGLKEFFSSMEDLDANDAKTKTDAIIEITSDLNTLRSTLNPIASRLEFWKEKNDLGTFGRSLCSYAEGLKDFLEAADGLDADAITKTGNVIILTDKLDELSASLENIGGLKKIWSGSNDLGTFGKSLAEYAWGVRDFIDACEGLDASSVVKVQSLLSITESMVQLSKSVSGVNTKNGGNFAGITKAMKEVAQNSVKAFSGAFSSDTTATNAVSGWINRILRAIMAGRNRFNTAGKNLGAEVGKGLGTANMSGGANALINGALSALQKGRSRLYNAGAALGQAVIDGYEGNKGIDPGEESTKAHKATDLVGNGAVNSLNAAKDKVSTAAAGLADGSIIKPITEHVNKGMDMVNGQIENGLSGTLDSLHKSATDRINSIKSTVADTKALTAEYEKQGMGHNQALNKAMNEEWSKVLGLDGATDATDKAAKSSKAAAEAAEELGGAATDAAGGMSDLGSSTSSAGSAADSTTDKLNEMAKSLDFFSSFDPQISSKISPEKMLSNFQSQAKGLKQFYSNLQVLAMKGFDKSIIKEFVDEGISAYPKVSGMLEATAQQVQELNAAWNSREVIAAQAEQMAQVALSTSSEIANLKAVDEQRKQNINIANDAYSQYQSIANGIIAKGGNVATELQNSNSQAAQSWNQFVVAAQNAGYTIEDVNKLLASGASGFEYHKNAVLEATEAYAKAASVVAQFKDIASQIGSTMEKQYESSISMFDEFNSKFELTGDKLMQNVQSQIDGIMQMGANVNKIIQHGGQDIIAQFGDKLTPEIANAMAQLSDDQTAKLTTMLQTLQQLPATMSAQNQQVWFQYGQIGGMGYQQALQQMASSGAYLQQAGVIGQQVAQGLANGLAANQGIATAQGQTTGAAFVESVGTGAQTHSPSRYTTQVGIYVGQGLIQGITQIQGQVLSVAKTLGDRSVVSVMQGMNSKKGQLFNTIRTIGSTAISTMRSALPSNAFYGIGANAGQGLVDGLNSKAYAVQQAAKALADAAVVTVKGPKGFDEGSPSKVMRKVGQFFTRGLAIGIASESNSVGNSAHEAAMAALSTANDILSGDTEVNPTITPVVDMNNVYSSAGAINGLFGTQGFSVNASLGTVHTPQEAMRSAVAANNSSGDTYTYGGASINVYGAPGQDVDQLADVVVDKLDSIYARRKAVWE